ncbi:MAG TPA: FecR family protein [bacterium]|nr:FecR family protein [bacterium]HPN34227.1 FecR family protein [bacterium]
MRAKLLLLAGLLFTAGRPAAADVTEMAFVLKVSGDAKIKTAKQDWAALLKGARIRNGDRIKTGENGLVSLVFIDDKALMKIRANSQVEIRGERNAKGIGKELAMQIGEAWNKVSPNGPGFRIETPSGVAAVKGTEFYTLVDDQGQTFVYGIEGLIQLLNELGEVMVAKGQMGFSKKGAKPTAVAAARTPDWSMGDEIQELNIEFENSDGGKKNLQIKFKKK